MALPFSTPLQKRRVFCFCSCSCNPKRSLIPNGFILHWGGGGASLLFLRFPPQPELFFIPFTSSSSPGSHLSPYLSTISYHIIHDSIHPVCVLSLCRRLRSEDSLLQKPRVALPSCSSTIGGPPPQQTPRGDSRSPRGQPAPPRPSKSRWTSLSASPSVKSPAEVSSSL